MQFKNYLEERLLEIGNLEDRVVMRQIFEGVLIPLSDYYEEKYNALTEQVLNEDCNTVGYEIFTGIVNRKKYDVTVTDLKPMQEQDLKEKIFDMTLILESLKKNESVNLFTIFIKLSYEKLMDLEGAKRKFHGIVKTEEGEFQSEFYLKRNNEYLKQIIELYRIFINNGIPWTTVCAPYLYKLFEVHLTNCSNLKGKEILEISVDFEELKECIEYDQVPLWNLDIVYQSSSGYAKPCIDQIHYEHQIFKERLGEENYMVMNSDVHILNQKRIKGDLWITCDSSQTVKWKLLCFHKVAKPNYQYAPMHNKMTYPVKKAIHTKAAIENFIGALGYNEYLKLVDIAIERIPLQRAFEYHVDGQILKEWLPEFIPDEKRNVMWVSFQKQTEDTFILSELMQYMVTRLQWQYPEYSCMGRFQ